MKKGKYMLRVLSLIVILLSINEFAFGQSFPLQSTSEVCDFGTIPQYKSLSKEVKIINYSNQSVNLHKIIPTNSMLSATVAKTILLPGENTMVTINCSANTAGLLEAGIRITIIGDRRELYIPVKAQIEAKPIPEYKTVKPNTTGLPSLPVNPRNN